MSLPPQGAPASGHLEETPQGVPPALPPHVQIRPDCRANFLGFGFCGESAHGMVPLQGLGLLGFLASPTAGMQGQLLTSVEDASIEQGSWARRENHLPVGTGDPWREDAVLLTAGPL